MAICNIDPNEQDSWLASTSRIAWFMDSGASKHITSMKSLFKDLQPAKERNTVACANSAILLIKGIGSIILTTVNGEPFPLHNCLYVPGIKKNLLSVPTLARGGYHVAFEDNKCVVRNREKGMPIVLTGSLTVKNLYQIDNNQDVDDLACTATTSNLTPSMQQTKLWHARYGHTYVAGLMKLQKEGMIEGLPLLTPLITCDFGSILNKN